MVPGNCDLCSSLALSCIRAGPYSVRPFWSGIPLGPVSHSTLLAICSAVMCQGPTLHIRDLGSYLFLWQGSLFSPPRLSLLLIIPELGSSVTFLRNVPWSPRLVQMSWSELSYLRVLRLHNTYLGCNFVFISVIVWLRVTCSTVMSAKNVETLLFMPSLMLSVLITQCPAHKEALSMLMFSVPQMWLQHCQNRKSYICWWNESKSNLSILY